MGNRFNRRRAKRNSIDIGKAATEILQDYDIPNDVAGRAYVMSAILNRHDEATLCDLALDPQELRVVAQRYRAFGIWHDAGVELNDSWLALLLITEIGRGTMVRSIEADTGDWAYKFASSNAALQFAHRYNIQVDDHTLAKLISNFKSNAAKG